VSRSDRCLDCGKPGVDLRCLHCREDVCAVCAYEHIQEHAKFQEEETEE
jgi:hypothetical protein